MDVTHALRLLEVLPADLALELPGGERLGAEEGRDAVTIVIRSESVLVALAECPSLLGFAEAFVRGDVDVRGDFLRALEAAYSIDALAQALVPPPTEPKRPSDADAIRFHYDISNDFYALFLDRRMVYTCAYYRHPDASLEEAQEAKLDLVCRKLRLAPGEHLLDVGAGWGSLTGWAAARYGTETLGVTLSRAQADHAAAMLRDAGLADRARVEHRDYRDVAGEAAFDKIAAVGVIEHVGVANYPAYFQRLHRLLRPGGLLLNHGITHPAPGRYSTGMTFLTRNVFPGTEFERVSNVAARMEDAGFQILDVEGLGGHYARTTAEWLARLQARADEARRLVGERTYRTWIGYLAAASVAFRAGEIDIHQIVARRADPSEPRAPESRELLYRD
jgi:cyclopropane-fatty-acyl-phospholipid synthase